MTYSEVEEKLYELGLEDEERIEEQIKERKNKNSKQRWKEDRERKHKLYNKLNRTGYYPYGVYTKEDEEGEEYPVRYYASRRKKHAKKETNKRLRQEERYMDEDTEALTMNGSDYRKAFEYDWYLC